MEILTGIAVALVVVIFGGIAVIKSYYKKLSYIRDRLDLTHQGNLELCKYINAELDKLYDTRAVKREST